MQDQIGSGEDTTIVRMLVVRHAYSEAQLLNLANILAKAMGVRRIDLFDDSAIPAAPRPARKSNRPAVSSPVFSAAA